MAWFKENTNFIIKTEKDDSFGRYIADVYSLQNECLNDTLVENKLAIYKEY